MKRVVAIITLLWPWSAFADQFDYFFLFASAAAAQADATVGQYWNSTKSSWSPDVCFPGVKVSTPTALVNGISTLTGFWIVISSPGPNAALAADANMVLVLDRDAAALSQSFVGATVLNTAGHQNLTFAPVAQGSRYPQPLGQ